MLTTKLHNARKSLLNESQRIKTVAGMLRAYRPEIKAAYTLFPAKLRRKVHIGCDHWDSSVRLALHLNDLEGFKDPVLMKLLEGFCDWEAEVKDYPGDLPNRDFYFTRTVGLLTIKVAVYAYVKSDSPTCRVVVTGVNRRVVEEEIREIVCA